MDLARIKGHPVNIPIKAVRIVCIDPVFFFYMAVQYIVGTLYILIDVYMYDPSNCLIHIIRGV